jgi:hypothetical protein
MISSPPFIPFFIKLYTSWRPYWDKTMRSTFLANTLKSGELGKLCFLTSPVTLTHFKVNENPPFVILLQDLKETLAICYLDRSDNPSAPALPAFVNMEHYEMLQYKHDVKSSTRLGSLQTGLWAARLSSKRFRCLI